MKNSKAFHEQVAEKLIAQLKQGSAPWQKPWQPGDPLLTLPNNPTTGKRYRGINALHLMSQGRTDPRWLTYKQASSLGAQVRKGEKSTLVQYWKFTDERIKKDNNGNPVLDTAGQPVKEQVRLERPRVFYATVFNAEQIDNLPQLKIYPPDWDPLNRAEEILSLSQAVIKHGEFDRAFYRSTTDSIHLPFKHQFPTPDRYYATALHELGHWTGHESRLNRDLVHPFGSEGYAREELRAEIASMLLGSELGIGHDPGQHVAYVGSWIKALQQDPTEIFRAAADAEKIQDFVLSFSQQQKMVEQEEVKMNMSIQQNNFNLDHLSPDLATITTRNVKALKDLTSEMPKKEQHAILLVADAHRFCKNGSIDNLEFEQVAQDKLGFIIPVDWNGRIQIQGNAIHIDENGHESVVSARSLKVEPQFWGVYAQRDDHTFQWLKDFDNEQQAQELTDRLALIDAAAEKNEYVKSVKFARIHEIRIRNDLHSTEEAATAAKEQRKLAESIAMQNDQGLQKKFKDMESVQAGNLEKIPDILVHQNQKASKQHDSVSRQYLVVPYTEKDLAKAAGARWDKAAKAWYVGPKSNIRLLQRWLPENITTQQDPAMAPEVEFGELLRANGCLVDDKHPVMDGVKQRIKVDGDKSGEKSGFYVAHLDGHPAGYFKNNRTGFETRWKAKGYSLTDSQKAALAAQVAIKQQNRKTEQYEQQLSVAAAIQKLLAISPVADSEHPYLKDKNVRTGDLRILADSDNLPKDSIIRIGQDWREVKALREQHPNSMVFTAGDLLLSAQDIHGQIWSVQTIQPNGAKYFATGSRKESNFHVVDGANKGLAALDGRPAIVIAEGYATADTLSQALDYPVVAAFDSGNLPNVAQDLHDKYPHKAVIIAGDDDCHQELTNGKNPGKEKALEAAALVDGIAVFPVFAPGEQVSLKSSDFNDLANKSVLGIEAVKRQVGSVVEKVTRQAKVERLQTCDEHKQQKIKQKRVLVR